MLISLSSYFLRIAKARYFWSNLVLADLRTKYRRSYLGISWSMLHPLCITLLLGFVMSRIFNSPFAEYAPYILSGLILWEFIVSTAVNGCYAFLNAEGYIRQFAHPLAIYTLRSTLTTFINLCFAFIGLLFWVVICHPENINGSWLVLPIAFLLLFLIAWPLATLTALLTVHFRDFSQMIVLLMQAVWYVSPVFFLPSIFEKTGIRFLLDYNPIYHILCLFRAPLLNGVLPNLTNYLFCFYTIILFTLAASLALKSLEKRVIFYL